MHFSVISATEMDSSLVLKAKLITLNRPDLGSRDGAVVRALAKLHLTSKKSLKF